MLSTLSVILVAPTSCMRVRLRGLGQGIPSPARRMSTSSDKAAGDDHSVVNATTIGGGGYRVMLQKRCGVVQLTVWGPWYACVGPRIEGTSACIAYKESVVWSVACSIALSILNPLRSPSVVSSPCLPPQQLLSITTRPKSVQEVRLPRRQRASMKTNHMASSDLIVNQTS